MFSLESLKYNDSQRIRQFVQCVSKERGSARRFHRLLVDLAVHNVADGSGTRLGVAFVAASEDFELHSKIVDKLKEAYASIASSDHESLGLKFESKVRKLNGYTQHTLVQVWLADCRDFPRDETTKYAKTAMNIALFLTLLRNTYDQLSFLLNATPEEREEFCDIFEHIEHQIHQAVCFEDNFQNTLKTQSLWF